MQLGKGISIARTRPNLLDFPEVEIFNPFADSDPFLVLSLPDNCQEQYRNHVIEYNSVNVDGANLCKELGSKMAI